MSVPKSRPTSSYLSPRHFMAASTMSGSWPMILLGLFGSRYMIGGSVGSRPTLRVLPASPGYLVATFSGSHAAFAGGATPRSPSIVNTSPARIAPLICLIPDPPFLASNRALHSRALGARRAPLPQQMAAPPRLAQEPAVAGDHLPARERHGGHPAQGE